MFWLIGNIALVAIFFILVWLTKSETLSSESVNKQPRDIIIEMFQARRLKQKIVNSLASGLIFVGFILLWVCMILWVFIYFPFPLSPFFFYFFFIGIIPLIYSLINYRCPACNKVPSNFRHNDDPINCSSCGTILIGKEA